jgi:hypothetical protein
MDVATEKHIMKLFKIEFTSVTTSQFGVEIVRARTPVHARVIFSVTHPNDIIRSVRAHKL